MQMLRAHVARGARHRDVTFGPSVGGAVQRVKTAYDTIVLEHVQMTDSLYLVKVN
jgi:hypothetical protein